MNEERLIERLRLIEALHSGATTDGERIAAERTRDRILVRLKLNEKEDPPVEYKFTMGDMWFRKVFVALLRRYGIRPYRYKRQRYTTVMARVSKRFVDETLWPEFQEISDTLGSYLSEVTDRVLREVIHQDSSEAEVIEKPKQLPARGREPGEGAPRSSSTSEMEPDHRAPHSESKGDGSSKGTGSKKKNGSSEGTGSKTKRRNKNKRKRKKRRNRR